MHVVEHANGEMYEFPSWFPASFQLLSQVPLVCTTIPSGVGLGVMASCLLLSHAPSVSLKYCQDHVIPEVSRDIIKYWYIITRLRQEIVDRQLSNLSPFPKSYTSQLSNDTKSPCRSRRQDGASSDLFLIEENQALTPEIISKTKFSQTRNCQQIRPKDYPGFRRAHLLNFQQRLEEQAALRQRAVIK